MLICFFGTEGIVHKELVPPGESVNGNFYCDVLKLLKENVRGKRPVNWPIPGPCTMTTRPTTRRHSLCCSFWLQRKQHSSLTLPTQQTCPPWFFPISKNEIETHGATFWEHWRDPGQIAGRDEDADAIWLPAVLPIMEIPLGSMY
jgi:hypothetical protein